MKLILFDQSYMNKKHGVKALSYLPKMETKK